MQIAAAANNFTLDFENNMEGGRLAGLKNLRSLFKCDEGQAQTRLVAILYYVVYDK